MKITKSRLKQIIKEELHAILEQTYDARAKSPSELARSMMNTEPTESKYARKRRAAREQEEINRAMGYPSADDQERAFKLTRSTLGALKTMDPLPDEEYYLHMDPDSPYYEEDIESQLRQQAEELGIDPEVYMAKYRASRKKT